jgi:FkbH-like protein
MGLVEADEVPSAAYCLKLARAHLESGAFEQACRWACAVVNAGDDFASWQAASAILRKSGANLALRAKVALLGSYTTAQFGPMLQLAAGRLGIRIDLYESEYGQYRQEVLDPASGMYQFAPDFVFLAVHEGDLQLDMYSATPDDDVARELARWTSLWDVITDRSSARILQPTFVQPTQAPMGHLGAKLLGSRYRMLQSLNTRLGDESGERVQLIDCERIASTIGRDRWFDPRYWHMSKQAVALPALPLLARHTASVIGASMGLTRKCLVLDLDNTLWGGVVGEDGFDGIRIGNGPEGEAFSAFQEYVLALKGQGVILAVASKNNLADAQEPFLKVPDMRLGLDDFAYFVASWEPKPNMVRRIAEGLNIGLDSLVFVDDNPAEREIIRRTLPEVDVVTMPTEPAHFPRALGNYLMFESTAFTPEDASRTAQYRARAEIAKVAETAETLDDFYLNLEMEALVAPFDQTNLPRIAQLIGKTNQFNVTTRRHDVAKLRQFMGDPNCLTLYLRLRDRFTDHGLVCVAIANRQADVLDIDTWLMSCRVIGRTVETEMLQHLCEYALANGCTTLRGTYVPTSKNGVVKDLFHNHGFVLDAEHEGETTWLYNITQNGSITNSFIKTIDADGHTP